MTDPRHLEPQRGTLADGAHWLPIRVFFEDTDAGGIVYHANYLRFMERARSDFARLVGIDQAVMIAGDDPLAFVVRSVAIEFMRPARLGDALVVETRLTDLRGASMTAAQTVLRAGETLTRAAVKLACLDRAGRPRRFPETARTAFTPFRTASASLSAATEGLP